MDEYDFLIADAGGASRVVAFPSRRFLVGCGAQCELQFDDAGLSAEHAEVLLDQRGQPWVRDLTGHGQVWVNGVATPQSMIPAGSVVRMGALEMTVQPRSPSGWGATQQRPQVEEDGVMPPGSVIDARYRILRKLASGGMGEVYQAEHIQLGKAMALKVMRQEMSREPDFVARFKREAVAASRIGQMNIVDISDFGQTADGRFYFVMEYLDGETLGGLVQREGALLVGRAIALGVQVARALAAAHALGIVHRDLKPENVMVLQLPGQPDFVKVLDFGVAKVATGQGEPGHTAVGMVVGTPQYMSPEQAKGVLVDARTDIYSLGLILYELLAGRPVFTGETLSALMVKQVTEMPPPLEPGPLSEVPAALEALVFAMLEKDPELRPQTMEEVAVQLAELEAHARALQPRRTSPSLATPALPRTAVRASAGVATPAPPRRSSSAGRGAAAVSSAVRTGSAPPRTAPTPPRASEATQVHSVESSELDRATDDVELPRGAAPPSLWIGLVAVVLLTVSAVGGYFLFRSSPPTEVTAEEAPSGERRRANPPLAEREVPVQAPVPAPALAAAPPAPPASLRVTRRIDTRPSGADVTQGGASLGRTPLEISGQASEELVLKFSLPPYEEATRTVSFRSQSELVVELKGKPPQRPSSRARQPSSMDDDDVLIDRPRAR